MATRTTHRTGRGTKLYAKRDKKGRITDIQTFKRAHARDLKTRSKAERSARAKKAAKARKAAGPKRTTKARRRAK
jgi:hypothetical protein